MKAFFMIIPLVVEFLLQENERFLGQASFHIQVLLFIRDILLIGLLLIWMYRNYMSSKNTISRAFIPIKYSIYIMTGCLLIFHLSLQRVCKEKGKSMYSKMFNKKSPALPGLFFTLNQEIT